MKVSVKFVTVWRRNLGYPVLTDFLPFSKHSIQHRARVEIAFFYPLNDWKVVFPPPQNRQKLVVSPFGKVRLRHLHCAAAQRAIYLDLGEINMLTLFIILIYT